ncbi:MAG: hypothetical protein IPQ06_15135 [Chitinophagaceae bacterium]|nr:hypothetical protein [Chitinophagaceae bacterium]
MDQHNSPGTPQAVVINMDGKETNPEKQGAAPVATADRIKSIDAIRGVALLGILMMNIPGFGINWDFWYSIIHGPRTGNDYYTFATVFIFFEGTMRGLFSMLFGAGMILFMLNKKEVPGGTPLLYFITAVYSGWCSLESSMPLYYYGREIFYFSMVFAVCCCLPFAN